MAKTVIDYCDKTVMAYCGKAVARPIVTLITAAVFFQHKRLLPPNWNFFLATKKTWSIHSRLKHTGECGRAVLLQIPVTIN
jgi:hypothetical protein